MVADPFPSGGRFNSSVRKIDALQQQLKDSVDEVGLSSMAPRGAAG